MEVGETVPIDFGDARIALVPWDGEPMTVAEIEHPRTPVLLYDTLGDELWQLDGTAAFGLFFSPFAEQAVASAFWQLGPGSEGGSAEPETVLIDLESMRVRRLLPVSAQGANWASPTLVRLVLRRNEARDRPHDWQPGVYEVDPEANTVTFVDDEEQLSLSPDGGFALLMLPPPAPIPSASLRETSRRGPRSPSTPSARVTTTHRKHGCRPTACSSP